MKWREQQQQQQRQNPFDSHLRDIAGGALVVGRHRHGEVAAEVVRGVLELIVARLDAGSWR